MSDKKTGYAHLRVRISETDKDFLRHSSTRNGIRPNISRVVKSLIEKARMERPSVTARKSTLRDIHHLAKVLRRTPSQVTDEAISAIMAMVDDDQIPLIVLELRLARKFLGTNFQTPRQPQLRSKGLLTKSRRAYQRSSSPHT